MNLISVDMNKCIQCGFCVQECPAGSLAMGEGGPRAIKPETCIRCGHCVAVCEQDALDNIFTPLKNQQRIDSYPVLDAETAEIFLRSRRSIRSYEKKSVPRETMRRLVNIARFAPTASNSQGISYRVVDDRALLDKTVEMTIDWMEKTVQAGGGYHKSFPRYVRAFRETGHDGIFRNAPSLVAASALATLKSGRDNTVFSLAYLELFAGSMGLGSCWAGLFELYAAANQEQVNGLLGIPPGHVLTGAVMVGYPRHRYHKLVDRDPLNITWADSPRSTLPG